MATAKDMILEQLGIGQFLLEKFTADLSDDEYFKIPAEGANHPAWIIGHIAVSEDSLVAAATGGEKEIAESLQELFKGGSKCVADAATYPTRTVAPGPWNGRLDRDRALMAAMPARVSGEFSRSNESTLMMTWPSLL